MTAADLSGLASETFRDALPMIPVLFVLYTVLELLSHREGSRIIGRSMVPRGFGPLAGALLGAIPQCGMSVFMTSLYVTRRITTGTLVATYLATSDEALPVFLAHDAGARVILQLVGIKLVVATVAGAIVDVVPGLRHNPVAVLPPASRSSIQIHVENEMHRTNWSRVALHSLRRTAEIFAWVWAISTVLGTVVHLVDPERLARAARNHSVLELVGAALFGLIPNCAASIALAEAYLRGMLSFGATVAGLCVGAGYGPILLMRRGLFGTAVKLLSLSLAFSIAAGALVSLFPLGR